MPDVAGRLEQIPDTLAVPSDLNGPAGSANGGVAAGLLGSLCGPAARVRLYRPPTLGVPMDVVEASGGLEAHYRGDVVLAAAPSRIDVNPPAVTLEEAESAAAPFVGHAAVTCVVCGPEHPHGLRLAPGPLGDGAVHATTWTPPPWTGDGAGLVRPEIVWGVLDCPAAIMLVRHYPGEDLFPALGTITAEVAVPVAVGETYVVVAWPRGRDGRKLYAGTAVLGPAGAVHARSDQICLAMPYAWGGPA
jgi:hypothetical protein